MFPSATIFQTETVTQDHEDFQEWFRVTPSIRRWCSDFEQLQDPQGWLFRYFQQLFIRNFAAEKLRQVHDINPFDRIVFLRPDIEFSMPVQSL